MTDETFSFRWGISLLDAGDTRIPNFFFDRYIEAGVTRTEFLMILHLARYQYERLGAECRPSVGTVARQMGVTPRRIQQLLAGLEERALLIRNFRSGRSTIYDFSGFSRAVLALELSTVGGEENFTPEENFRGRGEENFTPGVKKTSPEEEQHKQQTITVGGGLNEEQILSRNLLVGFGVDQKTAGQLARRHGLVQVRGWIDYTNNARGVRNPVGLVISRLKDNIPVPEPNGGNSRGHQLETKTCPVCFLVKPTSHICSDCGRCINCCECEVEEIAHPETSLSD